jgi:hypothetical protein
MMASIGNMWIHTMLVGLTVVLSMSTVFVSTAAGVTLMKGGFNPMAASTMEFMKREFEFAFLATRFQFFTSLLSFLAALALRAWTIFEGPLGTGIMLLFGGGALVMTGKSKPRAPALACPSHSLSRICVRL